MTSLGAGLPSVDEQTALVPPGQRPDVDLIFRHEGLCTCHTNPSTRPAAGRSSVERRNTEQQIHRTGRAGAHLDCLPPPSLTPTMAAQLASHLYFERQEPGSMLCAQHAINALVQHPAMDAGQLAGIAAMLDEAERDQLGADTVAAARAADPRTANMDDTGFFSVAVIETALHAWGLRLERLASPAMAHVRTEPQLQLGFLLNLESHWLAYRSVGSYSQFWFNLNSFLPEPQPIGPLYLSELLRASEAERYTVFVVLPDSPEAAHAFHRTEVDQFADLHEPAEGASSARGAPHQLTSIDLIGSEQDDVELQAALQASLADVQAGPLEPQLPSATSLPEAEAPSPPRQQRRRRRRNHRSSLEPSSDRVGDDDVTATSSQPMAMGRRRSSARQVFSVSSSDASASLGGSLSVHAARRAAGMDAGSVDMQDDQLADMLSSSARSPFAHPAVRGTVEGGQSDSDVQPVDLNTAQVAASSSSGPSGSTSSGRRRQRQRRRERAERDRELDEQAAAQASAAGYDDVNLDDLEAEDDSFADLQHAMWDRAAAQFAAVDRGDEPALGMGSFRSNTGDRACDDEDAALQAALAASMGDTSALERLRNEPAHTALVSQQDRYSSSRRGSEGRRSGSPRPIENQAPADVQRIARMRGEAAAAAQREVDGQAHVLVPEPDTMDAEEASQDSGADEEDVSPEEMRRRRLARFG